MAISSVPCMNGGDGETSYAKNSSIQAGAIKDSRSVVVEAIIKLVEEANGRKLTIVDLGCASGPNTLSVVANIAETIEKACQRLGRPLMELQFFLTDLPANDFNYVFSSIQSNKVLRNTNIPRHFIAAVAGSFYHRLFPERSIDFIHSSYSIHWLSQDPLKSDQNGGSLINKGKIYISTESPSYVKDAYLRQFKQDFSNFLRLRSVEMSIGGRMVLTLIGRRGSDPTTGESSKKYDLMSAALMDMVKEGLIPEEKVDSFNLPFYAPCPDEVAQEVIKEGSFSLEYLNVHEVDFDPEEGISLNFTESQRRAKSLQAVLEPQLGRHFGSGIIDDLFGRFKIFLDKTTSESLPKMTYVLMSLVREVPRKFL